MNSPTLLDLSHQLFPSKVQIYPGDVPYTFQPIATVPKDGYSVHAISLGSHTGTHIDAPSHFFADGKSTHDIPLTDLIAPFVLIDLSARGLEERQVISWEDIQSSPNAGAVRAGKILLIHTGWSQYWNTLKYYHHPYLSREAAQNILDRGVRILGMDTLNPDETPYEGVGGQAGFGVHEVLLGAGGVIAENLTGLEGITEHDMCALIPLNLGGSDGAPVRAFVWKS